MLARIDDHAEQALELLLDQYKEKPLIAALLSAFVNRCQELEDAAWDVKVKRVIENAENAQLDALGRLVVEPREDRDDATYRLFILAKIRINWSQGNPDDVIAVLRIVEAAPFRYIEYYPASFEIQYDEPPAADYTVLAELVSRAKEAGMSYGVVGSSYDNEHTLQCTYLDDGETSTTHGLAGNDETTGGRVAGFYLNPNA